jgi:hypothetical protein
MMNYRTIVIAERITEYNKWIWDMPSYASWYLIKLVSGVPTSSINVDLDYHRLFIKEKEKTIIKLVANIGKRW